jgi:predicted DNA-binding transcriptional regulator YafY
MIREFIQKAIADESVVLFQYRSVAEGEFMRRTCSPWQADAESFIGWDHARDEIRRYRYDRIGRPKDPAGAAIAFPNDHDYVRPTD